jgi:hypothetical protein
MNLQSRVPYMTDSEFNQAVIGLMSSTAMTMNAENETYVSDSIARKRQAELGYTPPSDIDMSVGQNDEISLGEARIIREEFAKGFELKEIAKSMKISVNLAIAVIDGKVWPYAGGPLRALTGIGLNETGYTANQRKFIAGTLKLMRREFTAQQFEIVIDSNGLLIADVDRLILNLEQTDGRETPDRRRDLLVSHAKGEDLEKRAASFRPRFRRKAKKR